MSQHGTSRAYAMERLAREAPELLAKVEAGEISAHAAMVEAGLRQPRFTVAGDDPAKIARTLRRQLSPEVLDGIARELLADAA